MQANGINLPPLDAVLTKLDVGVCYISPDGTLGSFNDTYCKLLDLPDNLCRVGVSIAEIFEFVAQRGEFGSGDVSEMSARYLAPLQERRSITYERTRPNGDIILVKGVPIDDGGYLYSLEDVTASRLAFQELRESNKDLDRLARERSETIHTQEQALADRNKVLQTVVENVTQGISLFDADFRLVICNRCFLDLLELPEHLAEPGTPLDDYFRFNAQRGEYGDGNVEEQVEERMALARQMVAHDFHRTRPDGRIIHIVGQPVNDGFVTTYTDITDIQGIQAQLMESERMASLGGLVTGVAHEINTPLGISVTTSSKLDDLIQELSQEFEDNGLSRSAFQEFLVKGRELSTVTLQNLRRTAGIVSNFKQVAVDQSHDEARHIHLKEALEGWLATLHSQLKRTQVKVALDCDETLSLNTFPGAIGLIVTNLVTNSLLHAFDAADDGNIRLTAAREGAHYVLRYTDDGFGMDQKTLDQMFEPFFTTKRGRGSTGLGMYMIYNLVTQKLGGSIDCQSRPGEGTRFEIRFPELPMNPEGI